MTKEERIIELEKTNIEQLEELNLLRHDNYYLSRELREITERLQEINYKYQLLRGSYNGY